MLSTQTQSLKVSEKKGQPTWINNNLPDLRTLERDMRSQALDVEPNAATHEAAVEVVARHFGFDESAATSIAVPTPAGEVRIHRSSIYHIVEKRMDARERYVRMALDTLTGPFEIWNVAFTDDTYRLAYIGAYETKRQMLVSVAQRNGKILWNYMQNDAKSLNKHRHGELLYKRYTLLDRQRKGPL